MKTEKKSATEKKRIPYISWSNSHLSIAKFSGGIIINGVDYYLDYKNCEKKVVDGETMYFPDLIEL